MKSLPLQAQVGFSDEALLKQLAASPTFQKYESTHAAHTGLGLALQGTHSGELALCRKPGSAFCTLMAAHKSTCSACRTSQKLLLQAATDSPRSRCCIFGLAEAAAPIHSGSRVIGFLVTGQFFRRAQTQWDFERILGKIRALGVNSQLAPLRAAQRPSPAAFSHGAESSTLLARCGPTFETHQNGRSIVLLWPTEWRHDGLP